MISNSQTSKAKLKNFFHQDPELTELNIPELTNIDSITNNNLYLNGLYINNSNLKKINFENLEQSPYVLLGNNLLSVNLEKLKRIEPKYNGIIADITSYSFLNNTKIQKLNLPNFEGVTNNIQNSDYGVNNSGIPSFSNNYWLKDVNLGNKNIPELNSVHLNGYWFTNCYFLKYLRIQYPFFIPLSSTIGLLTTPIEPNSNGRIYVPQELVNYYKSSETGGPWNYFEKKFFPLEQYDKDIQAYNANSLDNKSWAEIIEDCRLGNDIETKYHVGQTKTITIDGMPTEMVIAHIKKDITNENKVASLTWIEKTISRFNTYAVTTNSQYNYAYAEDFKNVMNELYNKIDDTNLKSGIKSVFKSAYGYTSTSTDSTLLSLVDAQNNREAYKLWPPSLIELGFGNINDAYNYFKTEDNGVTIFARPNYRLGETNLYQKNNEYINIALRDFRTQNSRASVLVSGADNSTINDNPSNNSYIIFGFCT